MNSLLVPRCLGETNVKKYYTMYFTARIRRMGKVLFSQASVCLSTGGYRSPRWEDTPVPDGVPQSQPGEVAQTQIDRGARPPLQGWDWGTSSSPETKEQVLAMLRVICLLRSLRRTFLHLCNFAEVCHVEFDCVGMSLSSDSGSS